MQMEFHHPYWPKYNPVGSPFEEGFFLPEMDTHVDTFKFSTSSVSIQDFSDVSSSTPYGSEINSSHFLGDHFPAILPWIDHQFRLDGVENCSEWMVSDSSISSQRILMEDVHLPPSSGEISMNGLPSVQPCLVLPDENMEIDNHLSILHLLKAFGDAVGNKQMELAGEVIRRLKEKASPTGKSTERLAFYLTLSSDNQASYLMQESSKNQEAAFKAFYQIFPYSRFAHFAANSSILEAIPAYATVLHVVDFDIGKGIQWPPLIETLGRRGLQILRLTAIRWEEESGSCNATTNFEDTKKQLCKHAKNFGLRLEVEETDIEGLVSKVKMDSDWLAFNCMVGLPHMEQRSVKHVEEFLTTAKALIGNDRTKGVITLGDGVGIEKWMDYTSFDSFFEAQLIYFQALLESMEQFRFLEARIAMECLFVVPHLCSLADVGQWKETWRAGCCLTKLGLEPLRMSWENHLEATEVVSEGEGSYWVRVQGEENNQMVLGYMGAPMVTMSSWI
ncbi:putative Glutaredoxin family protein [Hibiscus syriacus]|uniref:Glutaredoxin family protein n=1 Tax=Hibiscus syriacus TaxID=106335 RepID=A0A6A3B4U0_HIBSY|nr:protein NODULATION SIGNALING PATHWAY 2-like [Hibiscus syriacus]KAE8711541.1 putative Glutaredoxin family protein [Hibiscus syriacus]